jgi:choice-of-anchor B domain-containing protein
MIMHGRTGFLLAALAALGAAPAAAQGYGSAVAMGDGVAYVSQSGNDYAPGFVYMYRTSAAGQWTPAGRLAAPDSTRADGFGSAVALDGSTLMVSSTSSGDNKGKVYVFSGSGTQWKPAQELTVPADSGRFGNAIMLHGNMAAISAPTADGNKGAVYLFSRSGSKWALDTMIQPSDLAGRSSFGASMAMDGDLMVIGATGADSGLGTAYVYRKAGSSWTQEAKLQVQGLDRPAGMGSALAIKDGKIFVGMPQAYGFAGAVAIFTHDTARKRWASRERLQAFDGPAGGRFGSSIAFVGNEIWVGAPGAGRGAGTIYRMSADADQNMASAAKLSPDTSAGRTFFGAHMAFGGNGGVVSMPFADGGDGKVAVLSRSGNGWTVGSVLAGQVYGLDAMLGKKRDCSNKVGLFDCESMDLMAFMPTSTIGGKRGVHLNDMWGWTDPQTRRDYALVGRTDGTSFVDVTDPLNPKYVGDLPMTEGANAAAWRDIKTYKNHAYIVSDGSGHHGMQVFDLTRLRNAKAPQTFTADTTYMDLWSVHNIVIDTISGYAYAVGSNGGGESCGGGLYMIDIRSPDAPKFAGCFADPTTGRAGTGYIHDAQCTVYHGPDKRYDGHQICFNAAETALSIADVSDKSKPVALSRQAYPNVGYAHQGWLTADQKYFYMDDELDELQGLVDGTRTLIWDVSKLDDPVLAGQYISKDKSSDHNLYIVGNMMYQSNNESGLRVVDISDRENPKQVGFFDTVPIGTDAPGFGGSWSNYPFFQSGNVLMTSGAEGLFIVRKHNSQPVP